MAGKRNKKTTTRWVISIVFVSLLVAVFIRLFVFASFRMPSSQMEGTILAGDHIGVSQLAYGVKYPSFSDNRFSICFHCFKPAQRNDIVVYQHENQMLIGRCVGLPGDTIESRGPDYFVNGKRIPKNPNIILPYRHLLTYDSIISKQIDQLSIPQRASLIDGRYKIRYMDRYEHYSLTDLLPDSISLEIYDKEQKDYRLAIPDNNYWILCDNIDASADSRHFGFIPHEYLVGKATFIWFSKDPSQSWLKGYRFERFFQSVS